MPANLLPVTRYPLPDLSDDDVLSILRQDPVNISQAVIARVSCMLETNKAGYSRALEIIAAARPRIEARQLPANANAPETVWLVRLISQSVLRLLGKNSL
ncbi:MAG: hypothetical protein JWM56_945 [Candidatus Peribacteria bacterium]|nr:hypothetical protein [Candidatus Peribacteria bacterium]